MASTPHLGVRETSPAFTGERKSVSVLFSDLSGFTALSEQADPEVVRALLVRLLSEADQVVAEYGGHVEQFQGDAVMAVFGVPQVHEDDAVRAILAAQEIERRAERLSADDAPGIGRVIRMHSAIATGAVLHGEIGPAAAGETVLGDTVNVAARLTEHARAGEIVVGELTYELACGHFEFEPLGLVDVRGRSEAVPAYRLIGGRSASLPVHRLTGMRAEFIGRTVELRRLDAAAKGVVDGHAAFVVVTGRPGTGKSRLVAEFRERAPYSFDWWLAQCYPYSQDVPYSALKNLLGKAWGIGPHDPPETIRALAEARFEAPGFDAGSAARIGRLWGIESPLLKGIDPEAWGKGLYRDVLDLLESNASDGVPALLIEDIHWADRESLALLGHVMRSARSPLLTVCTSREIDAPEVLREFAGLQSDVVVVGLGDLDSEESVTMCRSLLGCDELPEGLDEFVRCELGGNPFFIEEMVNALVAAGVLQPDSDSWRLVGALSDVQVPLTVTELVEARVDSLAPATKRIAQEASLIGRTFSVEVLRQATRHPDAVDDALTELANRDLVGRLGEHDDAHADEWAFRHALIQEAISYGVLSDERAEIHDRIGSALEEIYADRATEYSYVIAEHLSRGHDRRRAVSHLVHSAEASMERYAVEEASARFADAYAICIGEGSEKPEVRAELLDVICRWARIGYYMGDCVGVEDLLRTHYADATASTDLRLRATYEFWFGSTLWHREKLHEAEEHLSEALRLAGEPIQDLPLQALAHAELAHTLADVGRLVEAALHAQQACELARVCHEDYFVWQAAFGASAYVGWCLGEPDRARAAGEELLRHADAYGNVRCLAVGHWALALACLVDGDLQSASEEDGLALAVSTDPWLLQVPKLFMAICAIRGGEFARARGLLEDLVAYAEDRGATTLAVPARGLLGAALVGCGDADRGLAMLADSERVLRRDGRAWADLSALYVLGQLHAFVAKGTAVFGWRVVLGNVHFVLTHALQADRIANRCLMRAVEGAEEIGAQGLAGECWLSLAELHRAKQRTTEARRCYRAALERFQACGAVEFQSRIARALEALPAQEVGADV